MIVLLSGLAIVAAPTLLVLIVGLSALFGLQLGETRTGRITQFLVSVALLAAIALLIQMLWRNQVEVTVEVGRWVDIPSQHFHFTIKFLFDRLSLPFVILSLALCGIIGAFASRYLHRDQGYSRFFLLYVIFMLGMVVSSVAGTIETMFLGWELVGLSSALLIAFFQERLNPVANGLRVWTIYRFADGAFLLAALVLHHLTGGGDLDLMMGPTPWPNGVNTITPTQAFLVGTLLLVAAAGKSALIPFSGWLPRAMEGPTPSSAIFYGALSVHLGAYLLLRVSPMIDQSLLLQGLIVTIGAATALYAAIVSRVQTDVKSALAFASLLQVSIIFVEIGFGLRYLALIHIIGHASMRTLQLLRAPSLLRDLRKLEDNLGRESNRQNQKKSTSSLGLVQLWCYRFAIERGSLDAILDSFIAQPFVKLFGWFDRTEKRWIAWLSGERNCEGLHPLEEKDSRS